MVHVTRAVSRTQRTAGILFAALGVVGGAQLASAQPPAPIVYATPAQPSRIVSLENKIESLPAAPVVQTATAAPAPLSMKSFEGAPMSPGAAIDQRPATTIEPASFTSIAPALVPAAPLAAPRPLPVMPPAAGMAEPYAGPPYQVDGKWYVPSYEPGYDEVGTASWYGPNFHGKLSATGETYDQEALTAAHPTLPIPSLVRVTNLENNRSIVVRLNDRGPFVDDRIIDLSKGAARALDVINKGTAKVRVQYVGPAPAEANTGASAVSYAPELQSQAPALVPVAQPAAQPAPRRPLSTADAPVPVAGPATSASPAFDVAPLPAAKPARPAPEARGQGGAALTPSSLDGGKQSGFYLQAGSFSDLGNAHKLRDTLPTGAFVTEAMVNGTDHFRVMMGPWSSRDEAEQAQARLAAAGAKSIVVAKN